MTQKYKQMSLLEVFPVSHLAKQDYKKAEKTIDGSGMKCLMLLSKSDQDGLLGKMCKALLISKTAWFSDRCKMTWKVKVSKSNVSLFQLQVSVLGTTETEYGFLPITYPSPRASDIEGGVVKDVKMKNGHFYRENKKGERWGVKLRDAVMYPTPAARDIGDTTLSKSNTNRNSDSLPVRVMKMEKIKEQEMYPTPRARDYKDSVTTVPPSVQKGRNPSLGQKIAMKQMLPTPSASEHKARMQGNTQASKCITSLAQKEKPGGRLNPEFVEFLMGYPMGWTEIEPKE